MNRLAAFAALALFVPLQGAGNRSAREGDEMLGTPAPSLDGVRWIDRDPVRLEDLRGKVVLIRWWMSGCSLCRNSAPALRELDERYRAKGLVVLGIYHPKPKPRPVDDASVKKAAAELGLPFPLGVDEDWTALRRWWLNRRRSFTSVSFVLDREGAVRWIHPGGEFHRSDDADHAECAREFDALDGKIRELLAR